MQSWPCEVPRPELLPGLLELHAPPLPDKVAQRLGRVLGRKALGREGGKAGKQYNDGAPDLLLLAVLEAKHRLDNLLVPDSVGGGDVRRRW